VKVTILTEGGRDIGYGHITRCTSIYEAFEEIGKQSQLIVNGDETIEDLLKGKNYKIFNWLDDQQLLFEILDNTNIVFIDSYLAEHGIYERISEQVETAVYFDDDLRIDYPKGFVLNGGILAEQMSYPKKKGITYLLGAQYTPLRKEFWNVPAKQIRDSVEVIMVTFGGTDVHNLTPKILKLLVNTCPEVLKKVIIGKGFQNIAEIEELKDNSTELVYFPSAVDMKDVMLESDIAVTASGQTLYELARTGVPTIGVCAAENQLQNVEGWRKSGFLEYIGWYNCGNLEQKLKSSLNCLADKSVRMYKCEAGRKVVDGAGYKNIVNAIKK